MAKVFVGLTDKVVSTKGGTMSSLTRQLVWDNLNYNQNIYLMGLDYNMQEAILIAILGKVSRGFEMRDAIADTIGTQDEVN